MGRIRSRLRAPLIAALLVATPAYASLDVDPVAAVACASTSANKFLGNGYTASGLIGVYAQIEYINRSVCTQAERFVGSWALSWVALEGSQATGVNNIFQGGYAKCGVDGSCNWNGGVSYVFVYYGHNQGACGQSFGTGVILIYNASSGVHDFSVLKSGTHYNYTVDSAVEYQRSLADVDTCWPGVTHVGYFNEMLNNGDQGGGPSSNHQSFNNTEYEKAAGWFYRNRTLNSLCDANSYSAHWHCQTSATSQHLFYAWDDRFP